ncbi:MAG: ribosome recycling factor [Patescibacteria group bacterium]|jgi:ribosome recycling factor
MKTLIDEYRPEFEHVLEFLRADLSSLRTGRAHAALVEDILVEAYGGTMNVKGVASVLVPDAKTIMIEPWDKALTKDIEKAIRQAPIGVNPVVDGTRVRVTLPPLTEESRRELTKIVGKKAEEAHIGLRAVRETIKDELNRLEKAKEISEDDRFRLQEALEAAVKLWNDKVRDMAAEKEEEIMTI